MMNPFFYINLGTTVMCFIFTIILTVAYFSKKNMLNIENKIYRHLIVDTFIMLLYSLSQYVVAYHGVLPRYYIQLFKISFCIVILWLLFFLFYIFVITHEHNKKIYDFICKRIDLIIKCLYILMLLLYFLFLSFKGDNYIFEKGVMTQAVGISASIYSILIVLITLTSIVLIVVNKKKTSKKKLIPFYIILPVGIFSFVTMFVFPLIGTVQILSTLIIYIMFHTIENPDMKMVNELTLARDQAEKANNAKSDFLSSMSHELRTPLNAILGLTDISINSDNIDDMRDNLKDIKSSSMKLLELVDGILLSNNIDNNSVEVINTNYNLKELIDSVINNTKTLLGSKNIEFKTRIDEDLPTSLYGDREKVKTIINNILSNAVKYTNEGYILLEISSLSVKNKCNLKISISDTGQGIKEDDVNSIFDKFYRSEVNKDSDIEGTGLGLSITKSLVELLDGKISVNSTEGVGTTFTITLTQQINNIENNSIETL